MSRIALFVDLDNALIAADRMQLVHCARSSLFLEPLVQEIERVAQGAVEQRLAYGNVLLHAHRALQGNFSGLRQALVSDQHLQTRLAEHGFRVVHTPPLTNSGKNAADIQIALDALQLAAQSDHIDTIAVLSNDSDFSPLVQRLRAIGRKVVVVSVGEQGHHGSVVLRALANHHVTYDQKLIDRFGYTPLQDVLSEADEGLLEQGLSISILQHRLMETEPRFSYQALGYDKLRGFIEDCLDDGQVYRDGKVMVRPRLRDAPAPNPAPSPAPPVDIPIAQALRRAAFHPRLSARPQVAQMIREHGFRDGVPVVKTLGELNELIVERCPDLSRSAIRDALRVFRSSGVLEGEAGESLADMKVLRFCPQPRSRELIAAEAIRRLQRDGTDVDDRLPELSVALFGSPAHTDACRRGLDEVRQESDTAK